VRRRWSISTAQRGRGEAHLKHVGQDLLLHTQHMAAALQLPDFGGTRDCRGIQGMCCTCYQCDDSDLCLILPNVRCMRRRGGTGCHH
jgi:hypothetical protein